MLLGRSLVYSRGDRVLSSAFFKLILFIFVWRCFWIVICSYIENNGMLIFGKQHAVFIYSTFKKNGSPVLHF